MTTPWLSAVLTALVASPLAAQGAFEHVDRVLTGVAKTEHFDLRFRPGSRAAASVPRVKVMAERDLADICGKLDFTPDGRFVLYLYDSTQELSSITRTQGNAGFSHERASHLPWDNDQTRYHEMVHIVAHQLPSSGDEPRNLFFAEGLANALLEFVHGVHVHAVATYYARRDQLVPLQEMTTARDFYAWLRERPGFNAYDVAASWFRFLLDRYGITKTVAYYRGASPVAAFGKTEKVLEAEWRQVLKAYELRPAVLTLLRKRHGEAVRFSTHLVGDARLPKSLLGEPSDWVSLLGAELDPDHAPDWSRKDAALHGRATTSDWSACRLGSAKHGDVALRARVRPAAGTVGVQIRLGTRCQLMVTNAGTFLWEDGVVELDRSERISGRATIDLLLVRRGRRVVGYIDGLKVIESEASDEQAVPAIAVAGGSAIFESIRLRKLP